MDLCISIACGRSAVHIGDKDVAMKSFIFQLSFRKPTSSPRQTSFVKHDDYQVSAQPIKQEGNSSLVAEFVKMLLPNFCTVVNRRSIAVGDIIIRRCGQMDSEASGRRQRSWSGEDISKQKTRCWIRETWFQKLTTRVEHGSWGHGGPCGRSLVAPAPPRSSNQAIA